MLKVKYKIQIGKSEFTSQIVSLKTDSSLYVPANLCEIIITRSDDLQIEPGDPVKVEIGHGELIKIFTGSAERIEETFEHISVTALSGFSYLVNAYANLLYEGLSTGDIVSEILGRYNIEEEKIEKGIAYPSFAFSGKESVYYQLKKIAGYSGFDFYADASDRAVLAACNSNRVHLLNYGENILSFTDQKFTPKTGAVELYGESPAGKFGSKAYSWIAEKEVKAKAGSGTENIMHLTEPALKNDSAVYLAANTMLKSNTVSRRGEVKIPGDAGIRLSDAVRVNRPGNNGKSLKITGVKHQLHKKQGFLTTVYWED